MSFELYLERLGLHVWEKLGLHVWDFWTLGSRRGRRRIVHDVILRFRKIIFGSSGVLPTAAKTPT